MAERARAWATVVYPDDVDPLVVRGRVCDHLESLAYAVSPLHDQDVDSDGVLKKSHFHVLVRFDSVVTMEWAREVFGVFGGVGCERVRSVSGYLRYLAHLDSPDKAQYDVREIVSSRMSLAALGVGGSKVYTVGELVSLLRVAPVTSLSGLIDWLVEAEPAALALAVRYSYFCQSYLSSRSANG